MSKPLAVGIYFLYRDGCGACEYFKKQPKWHAVKDMARGSKVPVTEVETGSNPAVFEWFYNNVLNAGNPTDVAPRTVPQIIFVRAIPKSKDLQVMVVKQDQSFRDNIDKTYESFFVKKEK